jgi:hypothetical protein
MGVRGVDEGDVALAEDGDGGLVCDFLFRVGWGCVVWVRWY